MSRKRRVLISVLLVCSVLLVLSFGILSAAAYDDNVVICHMPGTPAEMTKRIPRSALEGHLGHGDAMGACVLDGGKTREPTETTEVSLTPTCTSTPGCPGCPPKPKLKVAVLIPLVILDEGEKCEPRMVCYNPDPWAFSLAR